MSENPNTEIQKKSDKTPTELPKPLAALSQKELRARLALRKELIQDHITGLKSELTLTDVTVAQRPILDHVRKRPALVLGAAAAVGAVVGLLTGVARRPRPEHTPLHEAFRRAQAQDLLDAAAYRVVAGQDTERALREALRSRAPVVYVEAEAPPPPHESGTFDFILKTALGFGTKTVLDLLSRKLVGEPEFFHGMGEASEPEGVGA